MATPPIRPTFFWPIGDCSNRVPLYYLFHEKINARELIQNHWTIKQTKKKTRKRKK